MGGGIYPLDIDIDKSMLDKSDLILKQKGFPLQIRIAAWGGSVGFKIFPLNNFPLQTATIFICTFDENISS